MEQKLALLTWLFETLDIEWERDEDTFQEAASPPRPAQPVSEHEMTIRSRFSHDSTGTSMSQEAAFHYGLD